MLLKSLADFTATAAATTRRHPAIVVSTMDVTMIAIASNNNNSRNVTQRKGRQKCRVGDYKSSVLATAVYETGHIHIRIRKQLHTSSSSWPGHAMRSNTTDAYACSIIKDRKMARHQRELSGKQDDGWVAC